LKKAVAILILFFPLIVTAQRSELLPELMSTSPHGDLNKATIELQNFESTLKVQSSDYALLKTVFKKTQQKFLKHYNQYTDFDEIFTSGKYDCLTATSLFSVVLSDLHFQYRIIETNYHIFLMVETTKGEVLLETTDRYNGFVTSAVEIEKRLGSYKQNIIASASIDSSNKIYYAYHFSLYQDVAPNQLAGLLLYNKAVKSFNEKELMKAADFLAQSKAIYESPRVAELAVIIVEATLESNLSQSNKLKILNRYKYYWEQRSRLMAVR